MIPQIIKELVRASSSSSPRVEVDGEAQDEKIKKKEKKVTLEAACELLDKAMEVFSSQVQSCRADVRHMAIQVLSP